MKLLIIGQKCLYETSQNDRKKRLNVRNDSTSGLVGLWDLSASKILKVIVNTFVNFQNLSVIP